MGAFRNQKIDPALFSVHLVGTLVKVLAKKLKFPSLLSELFGELKKILFYPHGGPNDPTSIELADRLLKTQLLLTVSIKGKRTIFGGSTLLFYHLHHRSRNLNVFSIGDSILMVLRKNFEGKYYLEFKSQAFQASFNQPIQITHEKYVTNPIGYWQYILNPGDVIVACTDGLTDNLFDEEIVDIVQQASDEGMSALDLAEILTNEAYERSQQKEGDETCPFVIQANKIKKFSPITGGKPDDITVLVSRVE